MSTSYIAIRTDSIPKETKENLPHYKFMVFSNDDQYLLITGYHKDGSFSHTDEMMSYCVHWSKEEEKQSILDNMFANSVVYDKGEFDNLMNDEESIWYKPEAEL